MVKQYRATTGVDEFYYATLDDSDAAVGEPERIEFLQNITVEMPQEPIRAYGDNRTAEIAVSNGNTSVTAAFHKLPLEDRNELLGLEVTAEGLSAYGSNDTPPYAACVFAKTHEDGSKEWVGLPKGIFMRPSVTGTSKTDTVEFGADEITAEFMDREMTGFSEEKSALLGVDEAGETAVRDAIFGALFGITTPEGV